MPSPPRPPASLYLDRRDRFPGPTLLVAGLLALAVAAATAPTVATADECAREEVVDQSIGPLVVAAGDRAVALRHRDVRGLPGGGVPNDDLRVVRLGPGGRVRSPAVDATASTTGAALGRAGSAVVATWRSGPSDVGLRQLRVGVDPATWTTRVAIPESDPDGTADEELGVFAARVAGGDDGTVVLARLLPAPDTDDGGWGGPPPVGQLVRYPADGAPPDVAPLPAEDGDSGFRLAADRAGRAWAATRSGGRSRIVRWDPGAARPAPPMALAGTVAQLVADDHGAWAVVVRAERPRLVRFGVGGDRRETALPGARGARIAVTASGVGVVVVDVDSARRGDPGDVRVLRLTPAGAGRHGRTIARSRALETVEDVRLDRRDRPYVLVRRSGRRPWQSDLLLRRGGRTIAVAAQPGRVDERDGALAVLDDGAAWVVHDRYERTARPHPVCGHFGVTPSWRAVRVSAGGQVAARHRLPGARPLGLEYGE